MAKKEESTEIEYVVYENKDLLIPPLPITDVDYIGINKMPLTDRKSVNDISLEYVFAKVVETVPASTESVLTGAKITTNVPWFDYSWPEFNVWRSGAYTISTTITNVSAASAKNAKMFVRVNGSVVSAFESSTSIVPVQSVRSECDLILEYGDLVKVSYENDLAAPEDVVGSIVIKRYA